MRDLRRRLMEDRTDLRRVGSVAADDEAVPPFVVVDAAGDEIEPINYRSRSAPAGVEPTETPPFQVASSSSTTSTRRSPTKSAWSGRVSAECRRTYQEVDTDDYVDNLLEHLGYVTADWRPLPVRSPNPIRIKLVRFLGLEIEGGEPRHPR
jgi:hypothetical protein